jgi:hypothetical protein
MAQLKTLAAGLIGIVLLSGSSAITTAAGVEVTIQTQDPAQLEMAEWAIGRFAKAGLDLPTLLIRFPGIDSPLCDGVQGRAYLSHDPIEVRMCWNNEFILLHELAHVWEVNNLADDEHVAFMDMRDGVESWGRPDDAWEEQGREHAANVIAWGLLEDPYPISRTYPNDVASMVEAFSFLTAVDPLHDGGEGIQHPDRSLFDKRSTPPLEAGR